MNELRRGEAGLAMMCSADSGMTYGQWMPMGPQDELAHFGIKGMKHGRRRYQTESGEWTPLGMKERRAREGFGEGKSGGKSKKTSGSKSKSEQKSGGSTAKPSAVFGKKSSVKNLTDDELRAKINRLKLEQEYKELTKSPALKLGEKLVQSYMENKAHKEERKEKQIDYTRDMLKMKEATKQKQIDAKARIKDAEAQMKKAETDALDIKSGTRMVENKKGLLQAKIGYRATTIRGGIGKYVNKLLSSKADNRAAEKKEVGSAKAAVEAASILQQYNKHVMPWESEPVTSSYEVDKRNKAKQKSDDDKKK